MTLPHLFPAAIFRLFTVLFLTGGLTLSGLAADAVKSFNVPAGDAIATLKQAAQQAGMEIMFPAATVQDVKTAAVKGELTPRAALDKMLDGTGLVAVQDEKTGALAVKKGPLPNAARVAQTATTPKDQGKVEDGKIVLDTYEVTGSRLRLNSGERPAQPVLTFSAKDIERLGASSLAQLFQYIPSITSSTTGLALEGNTGGSLLAGFVGQAASRTNAQLRGGVESATLLLVDGKRAPRTGQRNGGGVGFDLGGIPLSAVERVEVLLDGASAIYGNDAIYGVINVILKKSYSGTEVRLTYDNTFDQDAAVRTASFTHGFARGKWSGLVTVSASDNNVMLLTDRRLTATYNRTLFGGLNNGSSPTLAWEGNGTLSVASGVLPGIGTQFVSIPNGSLGTNLTVADFASAPPVRFGTTPEGRGAMALTNSQSAYVRVGYALNSQLEISAMFRAGQNETNDLGIFRRAINITLPVSYPGNPFGIPVRMSKTFYDLPRIYTGYDVSNREFGLSAKGKLPREWQYEVSLDYVRGTNDQNPPRLPGAGDQIGSLNFRQAFLNTAIAAGRQPNLIYDSQTRSPVSATELDEFWVNIPTSVFVLSDLSQTWTYSAQADGPLFSVPAGKVKAVAGIEYREEYYASPGNISPLVWKPYPIRRVQAGFTEIRVPLVAPRQHWPLLHQLDLSLAARSEEYSDVKGGQVITPRYGVAWRPVAALLLRGSYGEGFLVPNLYNTLPVETISTLTWSSASPNIDNLRGNTIPVGQTYISYGGGNPDLKPQTSQNWTYGAVLDVPKVKGLSLSFDYFDNRYQNRFGGVSAIIDRNTYAPDTIVRGPNLPGDPAGWAGPIVSITSRVMNIANARVAGYNFGVRWNHSTPWGALSFSSTGEKILRDEQRVLPNAIPQTSVNKKFDPMRITSAIYWSRGPWDAGVTSIYGGRYWVNTTNATLAPSRWTDDVMRFDVNASYDFGKNHGFNERGSSWWRRALHDTKLSVTIINVANTEPPLDVLGFFSSSVIDMRLRRYVLDFTKRF